MRKQLITKCIFGILKYQHWHGVKSNKIFNIIKFF